jgi:hypothetical protein
MKRYTHPPIFRTLIASKEGSTVTKEWIFLRPRLTLNADNPSWEQSEVTRNAFTHGTLPIGRSAIRIVGERLRNNTKGLKVVRLRSKHGHTCSTIAI